jgi:twitching motility protein PilJ
MASGTNFSQEYGQAEKAYLQGNFEQAAKIIDRLAKKFPEDPNVLLLRGHIYCYGFQNYDLAQQQYEYVLELSVEQDLLDFAHNGIEQVRQLRQQYQGEHELAEDLHSQEVFDEEDSDPPDWVGTDFVPDEELSEQGFEEVEAAFPFSDSDRSSFNHEEHYDFEIEEEEKYRENIVSERQGAFNNPFANQVGENLEEFGGNSGFIDPFAHFELEEDEESESEGSLTPSESLESEESLEQPSFYNKATFMVESDEEEEDFPSESVNENPAIAIDSGIFEQEDESRLEVDTVMTEASDTDFSESSDSISLNYQDEQGGFDYQDELEFDEIDSSFFDLEELEQGLPDTGLFNVPEELGSSQEADRENNLLQKQSLTVQEGVSVGDNSQSIPLASSVVEPTVEVKQGILGGFINAPIGKKQLIAATMTGFVSAIAILAFGLVGSSLINKDNSEQDLAANAKNSALMAIIAGVASFGTSAILGSITAKQIERATKDLQNQFEDVYQGNLNAKATVYSQDEFGQLASGFNRMTRVILTTTQEAQRRAEETEQAKEDLQRQVIRLLDDVEGAARGDLTVQATVTADVLGAVADAFNLTIQSLREIVRQVKLAAEQVNKSSTDSELFARNQSSEALRMAEELAVTLNSVQMMTESIERVAENAREAEEVARSSSVTALKGGKAVERTVAGIFQIRETVSETARKVKRLAEASQEISKIVLIISQIAERTNQLALNASIQAAKAGEAGRGFAVVADEVRQLADRSGKSLKEIEQIVLQIQSETGSVMTAMEEGIQEVIDVTERAEQAKGALEDIIQVSNRIDTLVRSITADTVEQRENSRAVAQVMQSVELTAQATSQESQRVAGALQSLVSIARDLLSSVERFCIDKNNY